MDTAPSMMRSVKLGLMVLSPSREPGDRERRGRRRVPRHEQQSQPLLPRARNPGAAPGGGQEQPGRELLFAAHRSTRSTSTGVSTEPFDSGGGSSTKGSLHRGSIAMSTLSTTS